MTQKSGSGDSKSDKEEAPIQVDKWDGTAVKNALDDAAKNVFLKNFGYEENHMLMDGRLFISTLGVFVAMFAVAWDYLYPFPQSRFDHMYHLTVTVTTPGGKHEAKLSKSVSSWYDENGTLVLDVLEPDLRKLHNGIVSKKKKKTN